ncbi:unnamed protein product [Mytilus coruscus]|uniref:Endonuclease/exonuclease/phosphatase domain-containing protein n=1 Tax=Mytilus coruscus TaxID=42192 RepID=A0A6J8BJT9_MYTCO|nr:unnamed protein product [Mytilus coruscus]
MFSQLPDGNKRIQAIEISTVGNPTCLVNVYLPSRGTDKGHDTDRASLDTLKEIILKYQETHSIVIAGDCNASFIRHYKDSQDELFKQFCKEKQIELPVQYPTGHTYFQGEYRSQIDYILVKSIENDKRLRELIQVKILSVGLTRNCTEKIPVPKSTGEKINKDNYALKVQEELKDRKYPNMRTPYGTDQATNQLLTGLNNALETCYPWRKSKFSRKKKISWSPNAFSRKKKISWSPNAVSKSKKIFYLWKKAGSPPSKDNIYNINRLDSKRTVRSIQRQQSADKRNQLHEEIMRASDRDKALFFR